MNLAAYLRVSSSEQAQDNTIELQRAAISSWAVSEGHSITSWHEDVGVSGSNGLESRVGLAGAIGSLPDVDGIVVFNLSRLARDLIVQETVLAEIRKAGKRLFSTVPGEDAYLSDDPTDPTRKLVRQILGAIADYDRAMIRLRLNAGRERKRAQGGYIGGCPPIGYRLVHGQLVVDDREQEAIRLARELRAAELSLAKVADRLLEMGYPARGKRKVPWSREAVRTMVR